LEASASNLFGALVKGSFAILATCLGNVLANFGFDEAGTERRCALRQRYRSLTATRSRAMPLSTCAAYRKIPGRSVSGVRPGYGSADLDDTSERLLRLRSAR